MARNVTVNRRNLKLVTNGAGIEAMLRSGPIADAVMEVAERIADRARATAPVESGDYKEGIVTVADPSPSRARAEVRATAEHSALVESRTGNLRRAAR